MAFTLAYLESPVPHIPAPEGVEGGWRAERPDDRREHFGTEEAARRRAAELLPGPEWLDLRLYGPDGMQIADQAALEAALEAATCRSTAPPPLR